MLKEITRGEFDALGRKAKASPDKDFAVECVKEFVGRRSEVCEVTGWPGGEPEKYADAAKYANMLRTAAKNLDLDVKVKQRNTRVFMLRGGLDG